MNSKVDRSEWTISMQADLDFYDSFPKLLTYNAAHWGDETALRVKEFGIWRELSWNDCQRQCRELANALSAVGGSSLGVVALLGRNRPYWLLAMIAAHAVKAKTIGIYKESLPDEVAYFLNETHASLVFAENEEQVDKLLTVGDRIPHVTKIIYFDPRGMRKYSDPRLIDVMTFIASAKGVDDAAYEAAVASTRGEDISVLCTTSGTSANPKIVMVPSGRFLRHSKALLGHEPIQPGENYVSLLPLPWIGEQIFSVGLFLLARLIINFAESDHTTLSDMREIGPSTVMLAPRAWEAMCADIQARMMDSSLWKRTAYRTAFRIGRGAGKGSLRAMVADVLIGRALRDKLGLSKARRTLTGGASMAPDVFHFFNLIGISLRQVYGHTEALGMYCFHRSDDVDFETVGVPVAGVEMRINQPDRNGVGEIRVRHPAMFAGYHRQGVNVPHDELCDGWLATGDAGYFNAQGHLVVIDRIEDFVRLHDGERFSPQFTENKLKFSSYIGDSVVFGQGADFLTALVGLRYSFVAKWAEKRGLTFSGYSELVTLPDVQDLIVSEVGNINARLPEHQRLKRFALNYKELDADDGEVTRTRKLRRHAINERYKDLIDALYTGRKQVGIDTLIQLQDGRSQRVRTSVTIFDLDRAGAATSRAAA
jgi:long-chain acyl-CoA synthetase